MTKAEPSSTPTIEDRNQLLLRAEQAAIETLSRDLQILPDHPASDRAFWQAFIKATDKHSDHHETSMLVSEQLMQRGLQEGREATLHFLRSLCAGLTQRGRMEAVSVLIEMVLGQYPKSLPAKLERARLLFRNGHLDSARDQLREISTLVKQGMVQEFLLLAIAFRAWDVMEVVCSSCKPESHTESTRALIDLSSRLLELPRFKGEQTTPAICINLDRDAHRYLGLSSSYHELGFDVSRHPGILGSSVPSVARAPVFRTGKFPENAIGCCLSHIAVWEKVANGSEQAVLVLEDDGLPAYDFDVSEVMAGLPSDFDICFVNDRAMSSWTNLAHARSQVLPLQASWEQLSGDTRAIGADGYLLSKKGAELLTTIIADYGIVHNLDWQLYALGLPEPAAGGQRHIDAQIRRVRKHIPKEQLNAHVASIPAVSHSPLGFTARHHFD